MAQLRSCYFCGAVGDSLREYELLPERLVPAGESPTAVLCSTCHEKLRRVLEPLVEGSRSAAGAGVGDPSLQEVTFESADRGEAVGREEMPDESRAGSVRADAPSDAATGGAEPSDEPDVAGVSGDDGAESPPDPDAAESPASADAEPPEDGDGTPADADPNQESTTAEEKTATADEESTTADERPSAESAVPDAYYKVLRLLQNREFPMERADLVGLVTGAYDVSEQECERILETAVERGVLVEDGSTVRLGRN
jgi:hypothetical protein